MAGKTTVIDVGDSALNKNEQTGALYENMTVAGKEGANTPPTDAGTPSGKESIVENGKGSSKGSSSKGSSSKDKEATATAGSTPTGDTPDLAPGGIPEKDAGVEARGAFSNRVQYLLACIGYAVGLGNIWRFPSVAYENGGGAFLIPYVLVSLFFGLPTLYIECALGQFTQFGPSRAFKFYMPISQGIGWAMSLISLSIALYYNVIVAWSMVYLYQTVANNRAISSCNNTWNTPLSCSDTIHCQYEMLQPDTRYFNGSCVPNTLFDATLANAGQITNKLVSQVSAPDEFFTYFITQKHLSFEFGSYNFKIAGCLAFCWMLTALGLVKGVKWLGRISMVTATVPYLIIVILLIRGVTLEGANIGIKHYLTEPDFSKILTYKPWKAALTQICFSLSVGQGGMLAMSSYNKRSHKCFKDAVLVMVADSVMSVIGGVAVFSVLGFMANNAGKTIHEVVPSPLSLAFVAYPEAIAHMPCPILWSILFFLMIFILGISTMLGLVEGFITCLCDSSAFMRAHHAMAVIGTCTVSCILGLILFCFQNGYHFFQVFNEYIGSFSLAVVIVFEIVVVVLVYGPRNFFRDMESQFGKPASCFGRFLGPTGIAIKVLMCITAPCFALGVLVITLYDLRDPTVKDMIGIEAFNYPPWAIAFGLVLAAIPLSLIPIFAAINLRSAAKSGKGIGSALRVTDDHPANRYGLEERPSIAQFWSTPIAGPGIMTTQTVAAGNDTTRKDTEKEKTDSAGLIKY